MSTPGNPLPIQWVGLTKDDFADEDRVAFINQQMSQIVNAINAGNGAAGRVTLPHGVDVRGATVSNVGEPQAETDAVSQGHVASKYGSANQREQLDVGKPHALKGLTFLYNWQQQNQKAVSTIPATFTGGESMNLFGFIVKVGHTGPITGTLSVVFAAQFPTACQAVVPVDDYLSGVQRQMSVNESTVTAAGFTIVSSGSGNGAYWIAIGH